MQTMANHEISHPAFIDVPYAQMVLRKGLNEPELQVKKIEISAGSSVGDGYATEVFRITAYIADSRKINIIGKLKPQSKVVDIISLCIDSYRNESLYFDKFVPVLKKISDIETIMAKQYHVDFTNNFILMEDLKAEGFALLPRGVFLNKTEATLVMEALGKLHGSHYLLHLEDPSIEEKFANTLWNSKKDGVCSRIIENCCDDLNKWVDSNNLPGDWPSKLRGMEEKLEKDWLKVCERQEGRFNVLIHGDCYKNNIMFHKSNGQADQVRLLDFQILNYNCFANDLQYFLFTSVEAEVVVNDLDYLLGCYYKQLIAVAGEIPGLTFERIKFEFEERNFYGLVMGVLFRAFIGATKPLDVNALLNGGSSDSGFNNPIHRQSVLKFLPYFEKAGVF